MQGTTKILLDLIGIGLRKTCLGSISRPWHVLGFVCFHSRRWTCILHMSKHHFEVKNFLGWPQARCCNLPAQTTERTVTVLPSCSDNQARFSLPSLSLPMSTSVSKYSSRASDRLLHYQDVCSYIQLDDLPTGGLYVKSHFPAMG